VNDVLQRRSRRQTSSGPLDRPIGLGKEMNPPGRKPSMATAERRAQRRVAICMPAPGEAALTQDQGQCGQREGVDHRRNEWWCVPRKKNWIKKSPGRKVALYLLRPGAPRRREERRRLSRELSRRRAPSLSTTVLGGGGPDAKRAGAKATHLAGDLTADRHVLERKNGRGFKVGGRAANYIGSKVGHRVLLSNGWVAGRKKENE